MARERKIKRISTGGLPAKKPLASQVRRRLLTSIPPENSHTRATPSENVNLDGLDNLETHLENVKEALEKNSSLSSNEVNIIHAGSTATSLLRNSLPEALQSGIIHSTEQQVITQTPLRSHVQILEEQSHHMNLAVSPLNNQSSNIQLNIEPTEPDYYFNSTLALSESEGEAESDSSSSNGGESQESAHELVKLNDHKMALDLHPAWKSVKGKNFGRLVHASVTYYKQYLVLFGGYSIETNEVNKLIAFLDIKTNEWKAYKDKNAPSARNNHSAVLYGKYLIIFGGNDILANYCNDVHFFDLESKQWLNKKIFGKKPAGRSHHGAFIQGDKMYIHGGKNKFKVFKDMVYLDLVSMIWSNSVDFVPQFSHYNFVYNNFLYSFGGFKALQSTIQEDNNLNYLNLSSLEMGTLVINSVKGPRRIDFKETISVNLSVNYANATQLCGKHMIVVLPPTKPRGYLYGIWSLDMNSLTWRHHLDPDGGKALTARVSTPSQQFDSISMSSEYIKYFAMSADSQKLYLLGADDDDDNYLGAVLEIDISEYGLMEVPKSSMCFDFRNMFSNPFMSDFKIYCDDPDAPPIPAHKFLLQTRWGHFSKLQDSGMQESSEGFLVLPESYTTVQGFLKFLYTDDLEGLTTLTIADMLVLGKMYTMNRLQAICCQHLHRNVGVNNAAYLYLQATKANELGLRKNVVKFIFQNFGAVTKTDGFRDLPKEVLIDFWNNLPIEAKVFT